jgi:hypothetical protein
VSGARVLARRTLGSIPPLIGVQRLLLVALAVDSVLVIGGVFLAPESLWSVSGVGRVVADVGLFALIGVAAVFGPLRLSRLSDIGDVCLWIGVAFAIVYGLDLFLSCQ